MTKQQLLDLLREAAKIIAGALCAGSAVEELYEYANKLERGEL